nr:MAG TPA: hypothetical protein [Caudoviricetes sp.]
MLEIRRSHPHYRETDRSVLAEFPSRVVVVRPVILK